ncbi:MAG: EamA family transporter [Firmicutes bacterium]|nr:EamA family transporter [Bacillota bacterium]MBQ6841762.1 EamA family transporter [Bacillota bacterium]
MLYLLLAIASSAMVSLMMRVGESRVSGKMGLLAVNYIMCAGLSAYYTGFDRLFPAGEGLASTLAMGCVAGVFFLAGFVLLQLNVRKNGVVLSSIFMKLGLLVPMLVSIVLFGEQPQLLQILGFIIAVAAIILINLEKEQTNLQFKAGLILLLLAGGSSDAMSKIFEEVGHPAYADQFLLYTFGVALLLNLLLMLKEGQRIGKSELFYGLLLGVPNYYAARFLLKSLGSLPAVIVYPTYSVGALVAITLGGVCLFGERLGKRQWLAVGLIMLALILLNI